MITDTCKCGARFHCDFGYTPAEREAHEEWLEQHAACRARPEKTRRFIWPSEQEAEAKD